MAHNYYQQPQYYQPQNIYQQLGAQEPQPNQLRQGGAQIQQRLALAQSQGRPRPQSLVQQRVQAYQQSSTQHQLVNVQPQPPTAQQQLVQYQPRPQSQFSYPVSQLPASSIPDRSYTPWHNPQYSQHPQIGTVPMQPPAQPATSQRRPLPDPVKRSESLPQPRAASASPTRSRPLPVPTPGPSSSKFNINSLPNQIGQISREPITSNSSQPSSLGKASSAPVSESQKRGRSSPPKFSVVPLSPSNLNSPYDSSPSSPSSVSSLSPDSLSGSPVIPSPSVQTSANTTPKASGKVTKNAAPSAFAPPPALSKLKAELAGNTTSEPLSKTPNRKVVPIWKRTLPDVLPPLLPTPPPNPPQHQSQFQRQPTREPAQQETQRQTRPSILPPGTGPPPPIPSHSKPKLQSTYGPIITTAQPPSQLPHRSNYKRVEPDSDGETGDEEEVEEEEETGNDYSNSSHFGTGRHTAPAEPSSPQHGIRDLPARTRVSTNLGSLPRPPVMTHPGGHHESTSRTSSNRASRTFQPTQSGTSPSKPPANGIESIRPRLTNNWEPQNRAEGGQSMTMRLAAGAVSTNDLPTPPNLGGNNANSRKWVDLDDNPPPRSAFVVQRSRTNEQAQPQTANKAQAQPVTQGSRVLPTPGKQGQPLPRQRPQSQIYMPAISDRSQPTMARPQSQTYHLPLKDAPGDNVEFKAQLQRARSFGHGRQLPEPKTSQHHQQQREFKSVANGLLQHNQGPRAGATSQQVSSPPAPRIGISIESPAPVGGRDKRADFEKMESEGESVLSSPVHSPQPVPMINIQAEFMEGNGSEDEKRKQQIPGINVEGIPRGSDQQSVPQIHVVENEGQGPKVNVYEIPGVSVSGLNSGLESNVSVQQSHPLTARDQRDPDAQGRDSSIKRGLGLACGGCGNGIVGRIVSAMGQRWHPECFRCTVCKQLLEHVSSYEWEGKAYCHLDYHENFAPKCYSCKTPIYEERFISLDDPALGKRAYHEQHFFCSECGDPFLAPSSSAQSDRTGELTLSGDGDFALDDVGFIVYRGYPYCEACHVRLRLPKCKRCKRSIRDHDRAVEALGGKWCWACFTCKGCEHPFENPSFFERGGDPYCESCFTLMLRNEI